MVVADTFSDFPLSNMNSYFGSGDHQKARREILVCIAYTKLYCFSLCEFISVLSLAVSTSFLFLAIEFHIPMIWSSARHKGLDEEANAICP